MLVLYKSNIDKLVGTRALYPVSHLAIFELTYGAPVDHAVNDLKHITTIQDISGFAQRIIPATPVDDFCFLLTPFSFLLVRLEKNRVNEIQTSSAATAIAEHFSSDPKKPFEPSANQRTQRSVLNYTSK